MVQAGRLCELLLGNNEAAKNALSLVTLLINLEEQFGFFMVSDKGKKALHSIIDRLFSMETPSLVFSFCMPIENAQLFRSHFLPHIPKYCNKQINNHPESVLLYLSHVIKQNNNGEGFGKLDFGDEKKEGVPSYLLNLIDSADSPHLLWAGLNAMATIDVLAHPHLHRTFSSKLYGLFSKLLSELKEGKDNAKYEDHSFQMGAVLIAWTNIMLQQPPADAINGMKLCNLRCLHNLNVKIK